MNTEHHKDDKTKGDLRISNIITMTLIQTNR